MSISISTTCQLVIRNPSEAETNKRVAGFEEPDKMNCRHVKHFKGNLRSGVMFTKTVKRSYLWVERYIMVYLGIAKFKGA